MSVAAGKFNARAKLRVWIMLAQLVASYNCLIIIN